MPPYLTAPELTNAYISSIWETLPQHVRPTLLLTSQALSEQLGCEITIATETFQYTGSFKFRAAYNLLSSVPEQHIVAASSGNFGQAIAYASKLLGKSCIIVMPKSSAQVKVASILSYGGVADLIDVREVSRAERVQQLLMQSPGSFNAPAYDDYRVVVGNSTLGKEIFAFNDFDAVIVPIGGGGLSSGIITARDFLNAHTPIIGAEPLPGNDAARSLHTGQLQANEHEPATVADGARTISLGKLNWEIIQHGIEEIVEVPDELTLNALRRYFRYANLKVEPTGALALGAVLTQPARFYGKKVCCIVSGGNVDPTVYAEALLGG